MTSVSPQHTPGHCWTNEYRCYTQLSHPAWQVFFQA